MRSAVSQAIRRPGVWLACACLAGAWLPEAWLERLSLQPAAVAAGEWWRLWSGHFTHYSLGHVAINAAVILILAELWSPRTGCRRAWIWLILALPALSLGLMATGSGLQEYRGASGIASLLMCIALAAHARRAPRLVGVLAGLWVLKLASEMSGLIVPWTDLPPGVGVSWSAHLLGLVLGLVILAVQPRRHGGQSDLRARVARRV